MPIALPRPASDDYHPSAAGLVALVPEIADLMADLASQREAMRQRFAATTEAQAGYRYAAGKWSVREVLGHLCDAERVFAYRMLRIARKDETPLAGFDENTYVPAGAFEGLACVDYFRLITTLLRSQPVGPVHARPAASLARTPESPASYCHVLGSRHRQPLPCLRP